MWTSQIIDKSYSSKGNVTFTITYSNGVAPNITEKIDVSSPQVLNDTIYARLAVLNSIDSSVLNTPIGNFVPTTPAKVQADIDLYNFSRYMQLIIALDAAKSYGMIDGTEPVVVAAIAKTKALSAANIPKLFN